jgi:hypothetical protein
LTALLSDSGGAASSKVAKKRQSKSLAELKAQHDADVASGKVGRGDIDEYYEALSKTVKDTKDEIRRLNRQRQLLQEATTEYVVIVPPGGIEGIGRKVVCLFTPEEVTRLKRALEIAASVMSAATGRKARVAQTDGLDMSLADYLTYCNEEAENADEAARSKALGD